MMSVHDTNLIFFNTKIKIGRPEHSLTPSDNISFLPYLRPLLPPLQVDDDDNELFFWYGWPAKGV